MATHHPIRKHVEPKTPEIPDKLYFRIGDVARLCEVPAYVLRFWETEFPQLKPNKGGTGQRLYRKRDVEMALRIKSLLYDQGYTIPGARQVFKNEVQGKAGEPVAFAVPDEVTAAPLPESVSEVRRDAVGDIEQSRKLNALRAELRSLLADLSRPAGAAPSAAAESNVKTMRPRLVLEPKVDKPARQEPRLLQLHQRDLFGIEDDPGPVAS